MKSFSCQRGSSGRLASTKLLRPTKYHVRIGSRTAKEFDLLLLLARNARRVVPHRQILNAPWATAYAHGTQYLPDDSAAPRFIRTEPGIGYRLAEWVRRLRRCATFAAAEKPEEIIMAKSATYKKGTEIRSKLMGKKFAEKMGKDVYADPMMQKFGDYAREAVFGMLWSRPGLNMKIRALICVVSDTSQARWLELAIHLRMARNQGWTEDELSEALMHLCGYIGLPAAREGMLIAKEVFEEMRHEKKK